MSTQRLSIALKVIFALGLEAAGAAWTFLSLVRLGLLRHGNLSLSFLHLDWILQPDLPYWGAHMANLLNLAVGLVWIIGVPVGLYQAITRIRSTPTPS